jgi:hypothetical protein
VVKIGFIFVIHNDNWEPLIESLKALSNNGKYSYFVFVDSDSDLLPVFFSNFKEEIVFKFYKTNNVSFNRNYFLKQTKNYDIDFVIFNDYDDKFEQIGLKDMRNFPSDLVNCADIFIFSSAVSVEDRIVALKEVRDYNFNRFELCDKASFSFPHLSSWVFRRNFLINNNIWFDEKLKGSEDTKFLVQALLRKPVIMKYSSVLRIIVRHNMNTTKDIYNSNLLIYRISAYGSMCVMFIKHLKYKIAFNSFIVVLKSLSKLMIINVNIMFSKIKNLKFTNIRII